VGRNRIHTCGQLDIETVYGLFFPRRCDGSTHTSGTADLKNIEHILEQSLRQVDHEDRVLSHISQTTISLISLYLLRQQRERPARFRAASRHQGSMSRE